tara:strand:- start:1226 stop:1528 length:303 start_codon:yes stop_codon:yes gene_type:complete
MIFFWLLYFLISLLASYLLSLLVDNRVLKKIIFALSLSLMCAVWFKIPGTNDIAPIISIFLLESTILENNGLGRIFRPLALISTLFIVISFIFFKKNSKN